MGLLNLSLLVTLAAATMATQEEFMRKGNEFALDFYTKVIKEKNNENVIMSPFSVHSCLSLVYFGTGGSTAQQLANGLKFPSNDRNAVGESFKKLLDTYADHPLLKIANKVYVKSGFELKPEFNEVARNDFHSEVENIDFSKATESAQAINHWVDLKTNHKISEIVSEDGLDDLTRAILINAIYFKGLWKYKFPKENTEEKDFWIDESTSVKVDMMRIKNRYQYGEYEALDATVLEMPYNNSDLSMLIVLPNKKTGLKDLEDKLNTIQFSDLKNALYMTTINVEIPKFKIEFSASLEDSLEKMGITEIFEGGDFSNLLVRSEPLKVSKVLHKAFIEVNEEGTEAAAVTGIEIIPLSSMPPPKPQFIADRPFMYFIKDGSDKIYFMGRFLKKD